MSTQNVAKEDDLRSKYDVIIFAPVDRTSTISILNGIPSWNNAMPWQKSELTPNLGAIDSTEDMRPGLGYEGLAHLKKFVEQGGLLITCEDTAQFAIETGLAPGVSVAPRGDARVVGSVLNTVFVTRDNPVAFGYEQNLPVMSANGMVFNISNTLDREGTPQTLRSLCGTAHRARHRRGQRCSARQKSERDGTAGKAAAMGSEEAQ